MKYILTILILANVMVGSAQSNEAEKLIRKELARQQDCWNSGNLECFMEGYWKSDSLRFIGKSGIKYGWQETLDNYHNSYPDKAAMGKLTFEILGFDPMGAQNLKRQLSHSSLVMVTGKWRLKREEDQPNGLFTIIWKEFDGSWKIIYDHSS